MMSSSLYYSFNETLIPIIEKSKKFSLFSKNEEQKIKIKIIDELIIMLLFIEYTIYDDIGSFINNNDKNKFIEVIHEIPWKNINTIDHSTISNWNIIFLSNNVISIKHKKDFDIIIKIFNKKINEIIIKLENNIDFNFIIN